MNVERLTSSRHKRYGTLKIVIRRSDGSIKQVHKQEVDSLTRTMWLFLQAWLNGDSSISTPNAGGGVTTVFGTATTHASRGNAGTNAGIVVGTGTAAVLVNNINLDTLIVHGSGPGELSRSANEATAGDSGYTITRVFENTSGGTIDISEAGVLTTITNAIDPSLTQVALLCRDIIDPAVSVQNGESATVIYDLFFNTGNRNFGAAWRQMQKAPSTGVNLQTTIYRVTGATVNLNWTAQTYNCIATAGQARNIFAGTGTAPPEIDDLDLEDLIPHGVGSGELLYGLGEVSPVLLTHDNERLEFDVTRVISNESGADITIQEIGLFSNTSTSDMNTRVMLDRYVLPTPVTLAHGESRLARWLFRYAV